MSFWEGHIPAKVSFWEGYIPAKVSFWEGHLGVTGMPYSWLLAPG